MPAWIAAVLVVLLGAAASSASGATDSYTCSLTVSANGAPLASGTEIQQGTSLTLSATITPVGSAPAPPAGTWTFSSSGVGINGIADDDGNNLTFPPAPGFYDITGEYDDPGYECTTNDVQLLVQSTAPLKTTTTLTVVQSGGLDLATAVITSNGGANNPHPPTGWVIFYGDSARYDEVQLDANQTAQETLSPPAGAGTHSITAEYLGDAHNGPSSATYYFGNTDPTQLTEVGGGTVDAGGTATLNARLVDGVTGAGIPAQQLALSVAGTNGHTYSCTTAPTGADGRGTCTVVLDEPAGTYTVTAHWPGTAGYSAPADGSGPVTVVAGTAQLAVADASAHTGDSATLTGTLTNESGQPISGASVTLAVGASATERCTATTNASGVASCSVPIADGAGSYAINGSFAGIANMYGPTTGRGTLTVVAAQPTTTTYTGATTAPLGGTATLSATVTVAGTSSPVPAGEQVDFSLVSGGPSCTGTTDATGAASCRVTVPVTASVGSSYTVNVDYVGDGAYLPSGAHATLAVTKAVPTLVLDDPALVLRGSSATLSATMSPSLAGETVALGLGSQSCSATTDANGVATCTIRIVLVPTGPQPTTAIFLGGTNAQPVAATPGSALVYAYPSGGIFVVGDQTATGEVTFWGSQWWKANRLSGGPAPSSFKGFASAPALQCGATWTTRPGDSSSPPDAPLPSYMAVVVSSEIHKSGSTIGGDVKQIVVVRTDGGYDDAPGHVGTGTVVTTVCG